jgi:hypothetical protein
MQDGIPSLHNENSSSTIPYSTSNFLSPSQDDYPLSQTLTTPGCLDESGYVPCSDNADQVKRPHATFVKVSEWLACLMHHQLQSCMFFFPFSSIHFELTNLCPIGLQIWNRWKVARHH